MHALEKDLGLACIPLEPESVLVAATAAGVLVVFSVLAAGIAGFFFLGSGASLLVLVGGVVGYLAASESIGTYPSLAARRAAFELAREAPEGTNLMIMSLRHEPSLPKAIVFASSRDNLFSRELRRCTWGVIMGRLVSFEEALEEMGARWEDRCADLRVALHAMVTASSEKTEDGKRRALDRASGAIISGAKRRIEEYALSLSFPSMVLFGVGILLPLMVGSFLPMLSWSIWTPSSMDQGFQPSSGHGTWETVFAMNVVFPAVAAVIALGAVSNHPMEKPRSYGEEWLKGQVRRAAVPAGVSAAVMLVAVVLLQGFERSLGLLLGGTVPFAAWLIAPGHGSGGSDGRGFSPSALQEILFRTGARMVEGENFESALANGASSASVGQTRFLRGLVLGGPERRALPEDRSNASEAFGLVRDAARKDERAAGVLAMDLAAYMKDLTDLEKTLRNRLKPTISMMRTTAYALGPVVLGITFAIYLSLGSMTGPGTASLDADAFFLSLGCFLAEIGVVVSYFVWGIEGGGDAAELRRSTGACLLASVLIYAATASLVA